MLSNINLKGALPLIAHKLTMMRDKNCNSKNFRELLGEIASLMTYDVTKDWETEPVEIETPLEKMTGTRLKGEVTIIPILRAGLGLLNGVINMTRRVLLRPAQTAGREMHRGGSYAGDRRFRGGGHYHAEGKGSA